MNSSIFIYRNCYTGGVAGGDVHTNGLCVWLADQHPEVKTHLIYPYGDGQEAVYPATQKVTRINYKEARIAGSFPVIFLVRSILGIQRVKLTLSSQQNVLIASSHFLPDVIPVFFKGRDAPGLTRAVYIHHIVQDMLRPRNVNTFLANLQEKVCFALIKRRFDKVVVVNQAVADRLRHLGFTRQQILLSSNFVNVDESYAQAYGQKDITIAFCGRMMPQKGVDDFVQVCETLQHTTDNFRGVMIGIGPELTRLRKVVKRHKLNIELPGFIEDKEKFAYLSRAKLFVFPSVEEGWGIAVAEALAVGTPVLGYDLPIYRSIFGKRLHTVKIKQVDKLAKETSRLLQFYAKKSEHYRKEQKEIVSFARHFSRKEVAQKEYDFLITEGRED